MDSGVKGIRIRRKSVQTCPKEFWVLTGSNPGGALKSYRRLSVTKYGTSKPYMVKRMNSLLAGLRARPAGHSTEHSRILRHCTLHYITLQ